jgi:hypothetical protein
MSTQTHYRIRPQTEAPHHHILKLNPFGHIGQHNFEILADHIFPYIIDPGLPISCVIEYEVLSVDVFCNQGDEIDAVSHVGGIAMRVNDGASVATVFWEEPADRNTMAGGFNNFDL